MKDIRAKRKECIECKSLVLKLQGHGLCQRCYRNEYVGYTREKANGDTNLTFANWRRQKVGLTVSVLQDIPEGKKAKTRKPKRKKTEAQKWVDKLDSVFSIFIRLRDTDRNGYGKSIDDKRDIWYLVDPSGKVITNCDNGHYLSRRYYQTRWNEINCNAQSIATNRFREGMKVEYRNSLVHIHGNEVIDKLDASVGVINKRPAVFELQELYNKYSKLVEKLIKKKTWFSGQRKPSSLYR